MSHQILQPPGWPRPKGYSNGIAAEGRILVTGGMIGWDERGALVSGDLLGQTRQALVNVLSVLRVGGAGAEHVVRLTWYVTDIPAYRAIQYDLGILYRDLMGRNYPAMAVIGVDELVEPGALVEIEATAVLPSS
jgi:enamine deaminase RidA (YjgF/YER057c/UK114 family)